MAFTDLTIRPFVAADQATAHRLILAGLGEHFGTIDESLNPDLTDITATYITPGHSFVVAWLAGVLVGTGALKLYGAQEGELVRIAVSPAHRCRGIGAAVVAHLLDRARQRGLTRLLVETTHDWYAAIRLYQRFGFTEYARDARAVYMHLQLV